MIVIELVNKSTLYFLIMYRVHVNYILIHVNICTFIGTESVTTFNLFINQHLHFEFGFFFVCE